MTDAPSTPVDVVRALSALTEKLYQHVRAYAEAEQDAVVKRQAADVAESRAFINGEGAVETRKHLARVACERVEGEALVAEAVVRTFKAKIRAIETDIDVHRTFGATVRAELSTLGYSPTP